MSVLSLRSVFIGILATLTMDVLIATYNAPSPLVTDSPRFRHPINHYLSKLYVDTVCYHVEALQCCYAVMGAEHLLYGTDHPFGSDNVAAELVEQLNCPASDRELIYYGNAARLLNLKKLPVAV